MNVRNGFLVLLPLALAAGGYLFFNTHKIISGVVVPHHSLVANVRGKFFKELASNIKEPKTVIIVSPNHYRAGGGKTQTTMQVWDIDGGPINPNLGVIESLLEKGLVTEERSSFVMEHGIYSVLSDIRKYFPKSELIPLILKDLSTEELMKLEESLRESCFDCLLIASVDFSHYQPALLADLHDDFSKRSLENLDTESLLKEAEVDSGSSLALLSLWAKSHDTQHFSVDNHTNSGVIFADPDVESTTHIYGWYEKGKKVVPKKEVSFVVGGDVMFDRYIYHLYKDDFNKAFEKLGDRVFWGTDASVVNLEGAITDETIVDDINGDNLNFRFSPDILKTLSYLHLNGTSLANNHSENAGEFGLELTRDLLEKNDIKHFGGPWSDGVRRVAKFPGEGLTLVLVGVNLTYPNEKPDSALPIIQDLNRDPQNRILVMPHWGIEYQGKHSLDQENAAHAWIDAGADMVVGSHPHVIQDAEMYKGRAIIYSLGNFLFDQNTSSTTLGLLVAGKFTDRGVTFFALPTQTLSFQPRLMTGSQKAAILRDLYAPFESFVFHTPMGDIVELPN